MRSLRASLLSTTVGASALLAIAIQPARADDDDANRHGAVGRGDYQHVLLISVDGMHAVDLTNWIEKPPDQQLRQAGRPWRRLPERLHHGAVGQLSGHAGAGHRRLAEDRRPVLRRQLRPHGVFRRRRSTPARVLPIPAASASPAPRSPISRRSTRAITSRPRWSPTSPAAARSARSTRSSIPITCSATSSTASAYRCSRTSMSAPTRSSRSSRRPGVRTVWSDKHPAYEDLAARPARASTSCSRRRSTRRIRSIPARRPATTTPRAIPAFAPTTR